ncbi:tetratricopeptide repeat protein [Streptomyces sp. NPDC002746]
MRAESGYAYGALGADIHVFGNGTPVYLLFTYQAVTGVESQWLRAQPSRMLDARAEIVPFTGREAELADLTTWRDQPSGLAVRWLHGPGGQGKTRLAARLAADSQAVGWKVVKAVHGADTAPGAAGSQDLRLDDHQGLLLLVDYADRWPASHLSWLFHNRLLHGKIPTRVLLIGRAVDGWPALRGQLDRLRVNANTSDQLLPPLPVSGGDRAHMFTTAFACFRAHYEGVGGAASVGPPDSLGSEDFGLTLAVQMAALVAVDAAAHGRRAPTDMTGLVAYLLNREHENWRQLHENAAHGLPHRTPDHVMSRLVFTAVLTGALPRAAGETVLRKLFPGSDTGRLLADHALCYPPTDPVGSQVLEPLLPDRLAEDFLALSLPGSPVTAYGTDEWCARSVAALFSRGDTEAAPGSETSQVPGWTQRAVTFLAEAAGRWPHVGYRHLFPALRADPDLALEAGSAALASLAAVPELDFELVDRIDRRFQSVTGNTRQYEIDFGYAELYERAARHKLTATLDTSEQARTWFRLSIRLAFASRHHDALKAASEAVQLSDIIVAKEADGDDWHNHSASLMQLSRALVKVGSTAEAVEPSATAVKILRTLVRGAEDRYKPAFAAALSWQATMSERTGDKAAALGWAEMAASCYDDLVSGRPTRQAIPHLHNFTDALRQVGSYYSEDDRPEEALKVLTVALDLARTMAAANPQVDLALLPPVLSGLSHALATLGRPDEALPYAREAVALTKRMHEFDPYEFGDGLLERLESLGSLLAEAGSVDEAVSTWREAVDLHSALFSLGRAVDGAHVAGILEGMAQSLAESGRHEEALEPAKDAILYYRLLTDANPSVFGEYLSAAVHNLALYHSQAGQVAESVVRMEEAAGFHRLVAERSGRSAAVDRLASALRVLSEDYEKLGRTDDMLRSGTECLRVLEVLAADNPEEYLLRRCSWQLSFTAQRLRAGRDLGAASEAANAAAETYETLLRHDSDYGPALSRALTVLADVHDAMGNAKEARACRQRRDIADRGKKRRWLR